MSDDAFHLTPLDVRSQEFGKAIRGYDRSQVNEFKLAISEELERLLRDRAQQEERLRSAQEQLRVFRDRERAMNEALVAAQQLRVDSRAQAEREAELMLREAKVEAEPSFRSLLERHLGEVDGLQSGVRPGVIESADQPVAGEAP